MIALIAVKSNFAFTQYLFYNGAKQIMSINPFQDFLNPEKLSLELNLPV